MYIIAAIIIKIIIKKKKTCTVFLSSYRIMSGSLGEGGMLLEHKPQASVSTAFFEFSQTFMSVSI